MNDVTGNVMKALQANLPCRSAIRLLVREGIRF